MKKTIKKIKTFAQDHKQDVRDVAWYSLGAAAGIVSVHIYNKESFKHFSKNHPDLELILKDQKGNFHGFNRINVEE